MDGSDSKKIMGQNIIDRLSSIGMTRHELADKIGVGYTTLSGWCVGDSFPRIGSIEKMSEIFGCTVADLVQGTGMPVPSDEAMEFAKRVVALPEDKRRLMENLLRDLEGL